jgi:DNA-binding response OmpR family regulator
MSSREKTILTVDDERDITEMLELMLTGEGYRVLVASGGAEAIGILRSEKPDLVLLDIMMPDVDGHQVCESIRANPELNDMPVLMLTAKNDVAQIAQAVDEGADGFLVKPFDVEHFLKIIKIRLEGKSSEFYKQSSMVLAGSADKSAQLSDDNRIIFIDLREPEDIFSVVIDACQNQSGTLLSLWQDEIAENHLQTTALISVESSAHFGGLLNSILNAPNVDVLNCFVYKGMSEVPSNMLPQGE